MLATITVNTAADILTAATLRAAIASINNGFDLNTEITANRVGACGTDDRINFNIAGGGVRTISPISALPQIAKTLTIDG